MIQKNQNNNLYLTNSVKPSKIIRKHSQRLLSILFLSYPLTLSAANIIAGIPNTREDDTPMIYSEIDSFRAYCGSISGDYQIMTEIKKPITNNGILEIDINDLNFMGTSMTNFCVLTAVDIKFRQSLYSPEFIANKSLPEIPILRFPY